MKIIFLVNRFPPYVGGIPIRAHRIAKGLSKRGHEITVYTSTHPQAPDVQRINGMKIERKYFLEPFAVRLKKTPAEIHGLSRLLEDKEIQEADILQSFHHLSFASLIAAALKLVRRKVFTLLPTFLPIYYGGWSLVLYRLTLGNMIIKYADFLMPETSFEKSCLLRQGVPSDRIKVIPNTIDPDDYKQLPDPMIFRKKYNINNDERIVLFVGLPSFPKGLHHLVLAMHKVLTKIRKVKLVIVGPKMTLAERLLRDLGSTNLREHTLITGSLTGKPLASAYSAADVLVLPTMIETFGMVMLEAAAAGLPLVCTKTGIAPDIVVDGKNGVFVKFGKVNQISDAIIEVLTDGNFKREAEKRKNLILKNYNNKNEIDLYEKTYLRLIR